jgi:hypothetical protein
LSDETLMLSLKGYTVWDPLVDVLLARQINLALGGPFVSPWEIGELDDATIDVITSVIRDVSPMREGLQVIEQIKAGIRSRHPSFGKRNSRIH